MATAAAEILAFPAPAPTAELPRPVRYIGAAAARTDLARADLARARTVPSNAPAAELVQVVEALRGSLHDMLQMTMAPQEEWAVLDRAESVDLAALRPASLAQLVSDLSMDLSNRIS